MNPLEALLLFVAMLWLVVDPEHDRTPATTVFEGGLVERGDVRLDHAHRAEQRLQQLTDQAVLAMVAELRRQLDTAG